MQHRDLNAVTQINGSVVLIELYQPGHGREPIHARCSSAASVMVPQTECLIRARAIRVCYRRCTLRAERPQNYSGPSCQVSTGSLADEVDIRPPMRPDWSPDSRNVMLASR